MAGAPLVGIPRVIPSISHLENAGLFSCLENKSRWARDLGSEVWQTWQRENALQPGCSSAPADLRRISANICRTIRPMRASFHHGCDLSIGKSSANRFTVGSPVSIGSLTIIQENSYSTVLSPQINVAFEGSIRLKAFLYSTVHFTY
jgi:hypothetical protein